MGNANDSISVAIESGNGPAAAEKKLIISETDRLRYEVKGMSLMVADAKREAARARLEKAQAIMEAAQREHSAANTEVTKAVAESREYMNVLGEKYGFDPKKYAITKDGEVVDRMMLQGSG